MTTYKNYTAEERASWPEGHKKCRGCQEVLPFSSFHKHKQALFGYANNCKECRKPSSRESYENQSWEYKMWYRARARAKAKKIPFTIRIEDIVIPKECPVLNEPFVFVAGSDYVPSLDQKNPSEGYTPDNIVVMSWRANQLKNNGTVKEVAKLSKWMAENCSDFVTLHVQLLSGHGEMPMPKVN
ncbi:HNH endonuclease [Streptomyces phage Watermoore]|nr:HNH endonuclease [Streptomyces phage Watermoore]